MIIRSLSYERKVRVLLNFQIFVMEIKTQFDASLHIFRSDNAREYFHTSLSEIFL
jgi:hypothetical protein